MKRLKKGEPEKQPFEAKIAKDASNEIPFNRNLVKQKNDQHKQPVRIDNAGKNHHQHPEVK